MKTLKARWKELCEKLNSYALAMDYDPAQSAHHRISLLEKELIDIKIRLDRETANQIPADR